MENSAGKRSKSRRSAGIWHFSTTFWSTGTAKPCCQTNKAQGPSLPCHSDNSALHTGQDSVPLGSYQSNIPIRASATQKGAAKRPNACWAALHGLIRPVCAIIPHLLFLCYIYCQCRPNSFSDAAIFLLPRVFSSHRLAGRICWTD